MGENYFGLTDMGRQRVNNEDRFIATPVFNGHFVVASVIDGVGGYVGGEVAAQLTSDAIINGLDKLPGNIIDHMVSALEDANERIMREKEVSPQNKKMACVVTLAVVDIEKNVFYFAHVGDTRLYLFRDGSLIKVTKDHSTVGFLEESGRLTEEAAMLHPKRNEVNKVLGYETQLGITKDFIDTGESPFLPGDIILLCSDGLTDMVPSNVIISILRGDEGLPAKGTLLINAANDAGGKDNITVVLVHNDKSPVQHAVTKPSIALKKKEGNGDGETKIAEKYPLRDNKAITREPGKKVNSWLLFFCAVFFLGFIWLLFKGGKKNTDAKEPVPATPPKPANMTELNFSDSVNAFSNGIVKLTAGQHFVIRDTLSIQSDSLHIIGNGNSITADSAYIGPAFMLSSSCKYILLDSLTIENFSVGVLVVNRGLHLKNVRFKNCKVPLRFEQQLSENIPVSGTQAETIFYYTDSTRK